MMSVEMICACGWLSPSSVIYATSARRWGGGYLCFRSEKKRNEPQRLEGHEESFEKTFVIFVPLWFSFLNRQEPLARAFPSWRSVSPSSRSDGTTRIDESPQRRRQYPPESGRGCSLFRRSAADRCT